MGLKSKKYAAYKEAYDRTGKKSEAKNASRAAEKKHFADRAERRSQHKNSDSDRAYDFDSGINGNGTNWHTADDL